jgi:A nuclease family of the HNH/ENDO VII superfamily with conserved AHH
MGFGLTGKGLRDFGDSLTQQQRQDLQKKVAARQSELLALAKQATHQLQKSDIQDLQTQIKLQVLYENYIPAGEIYHFGKNFLNGYTPQKMQAVRGYFDGVFAGNYSKSIPAETRSAIVAEADRRYTAETGKQADRDSPLWKTLRNVQASEKYPDLWNGFTEDLSQPQGRRTGTMKTMTNTNDPALGSNALNRQGQSQPLDRSRLKQESFPTGEAQQKQQPVGGGFDNSVNPELVKQQEGFPTNQKVDGVTNVFDYTTDYRKNYEQLNGPIPAGSQVHHLAPRAVFNKSALAQEWVRRGTTKLDYPENLEALPQTKDAYDKSSIKIQHSGSHGEWSAHAEDVLAKEQDRLIDRYGSLNKVPDDVMEKAKDKTMKKLREDLLDKDLGLEEGWVKPTNNGMDKLSQAQTSDHLG